MTAAIAVIARTKSKFAKIQMAFSVGYSIVILAVAILIGLKFNMDKHDEVFFYLGVVLFYAYRVLGLQGFLFGMKYLECALQTQECGTCSTYRATILIAASYTLSVLVNLITILVVYKMRDDAKRESYASSTFFDTQFNRFVLDFITATVTMYAVCKLVTTARTTELKLTKCSKLLLLGLMLL